MVLSRDSSGQFFTAPLDAPLQIQVGDEVIRDGNTITVIRGNVVVATRTIGQAQVAATAAQFDESVSSIIFYKGNPVAGQSVVLNRVTENATTGVITFHYADGSGVEYPNWAAVGQQLGVMDQQAELAQQIIALKSFRNSPDGSNKTTMVDVQCAVNFDAGTPIALIEP